MKFLFKFSNPSMEADILNAKGQPVIYKSMAVIAETPDDARHIYGGQELAYDKDGNPFRKQVGDLQPDWELTGTWELSPAWQVDVA